MSRVLTQHRFGSCRHRAIVFYEVGLAVQQQMPLTELALVKLVRLLFTPDVVSLKLVDGALRRHDGITLHMYLRGSVNGQDFILETMAPQTGVSFGMNNAFICVFSLIAAQ